VMIGRELSLEMEAITDMGKVTRPFLGLSK
jgi:hypothetical protein